MAAYAEHRSAAYATRSGSVYLETPTPMRTREAKFTPDGGTPVTVSSGAVGCD